MPHTNNDSTNETERAVCVRLRGKMAIRFRRILEAMKNSEDLDLIRLGDMSLSSLASYGLGQWMKDMERSLRIEGGGR